MNSQYEYTSNMTHTQQIPACFPTLQVCYSHDRNKYVKYLGLSNSIDSYSK